MCGNTVGTAVTLAVGGNGMRFQAIALGGGGNFFRLTHPPTDIRNIPLKWADVRYRNLFLATDPPAMYANGGWKSNARLWYGPWGPVAASRAVSFPRRRRLAVCRVLLRRCTDASIRWTALGVHGLQEVATAASCTLNLESKETLTHLWRMEGGGGGVQAIALGPFGGGGQLLPTDLPTHRHQKHSPQMGRC